MSDSYLYGSGRGNWKGKTTADVVFFFFFTKLTIVIATILDPRLPLQLDSEKAPSVQADSVSIKGSWSPSHRKWAIFSPVWIFTACDDGVVPSDLRAIKVEFGDDSFRDRKGFLLQSLATELVVNPQGEMLESLFYVCIFLFFFFVCFFRTSFLESLCQC
jgi:hypothetical protein